MTQVPAPMPSPGAPMRPHRGTMILVFGILSWVVCFIFGIFAWVMGNSDLRAMDAGQMDPSGRGITQAGKIVGMVNIILCIITIPIVLILAALGAFAAAAAGP